MMDDIDKAIILKREIQSKIKELVNEYENQTKLKVEGIDIERSSCVAARYSPIPAVLFIKLRAVLP